MEKRNISLFSEHCVYSSSSGAAFRDSILVLLWLRSDDVIVGYVNQFFSYLLHLAKLTGTPSPPVDSI